MKYRVCSVYSAAAIISWIVLHVVYSVSQTSAVSTPTSSNETVAITTAPVELTTQETVVSTVSTVQLTYWVITVISPTETLTADETKTALTQLYTEVYSSPSVTLVSDGDEIVNGLISDSNNPFQVLVYVVAEDGTLQLANDVITAMDSITTEVASVDMTIAVMIVAIAYESYRPSLTDSPSIVVYDDGVKIWITGVVFGIIIVLFIIILILCFIGQTHRKDRMDPTTIDRLQRRDEFRQSWHQHNRKNYNLEMVETPVNDSEIAYTQAVPEGSTQVKTADGTIVVISKLPEQNGFILNRMQPQDKINNRYDEDSISCDPPIFDHLDKKLSSESYNTKASLSDSEKERRLKEVVRLKKMQREIDSILDPDKKLKKKKRKRKKNLTVPAAEAADGRETGIYQIDVTPSASIDSSTALSETDHKTNTKPKHMTSTPLHTQHLPVRGHRASIEQHRNEFHKLLHEAYCYTNKPSDHNKISDMSGRPYPLLSDSISTQPMVDWNGCSSLASNSEPLSNSAPPLGVEFDQTNPPNISGLWTPYRAGDELERIHKFQPSSKIIGTRPPSHYPATLEHYEPVSLPPVSDISLYESLRDRDPSMKIGPVDLLNFSTTDNSPAHHLSLNSNPLSRPTMNITRNDEEHDDWDLIPTLSSAISTDALIRRVRDELLYYHNDNMFLQPN